jgi:hypothetical protein
MLELSIKELKIICEWYGFIEALAQENSCQMPIDERLLMNKITTEIERRNELENLDFEDCDGCKL